MQDITLTANQVVLDRTDHSSFRTLWISPDREEAYWISLAKSAQVPKTFPLCIIEEGIQSGRYAIILDSSVNENKQPTANAIRHRDQAWNIISDIVSREPAIYRPHERSTLLKEASTRTGAAVPYIYKLLAKYWKGGMVPNALLPSYGKCGITNDTYNGEGERRGRKKCPGAEGKVLNRDDIQHFTDAIMTWYMTEKKLSLEETFRNMLNKYYVIEDEQGKPVKLDPDLVPSRSQFLYWHRKNKDALKERKHREGKKNYPLNSRASIEKTETFLSGPCASAQIDATIADIFLVSQNDRSKIVGRPTMYFLMDSFTRMVLGMHITLENPSWKSATMCILNSMEDKVEFCAKYGIEISESDWPCHHIPSTLVGDRGEMESVSADLLVNQLGMRIENTPPYRGDLKGIIESRFHTINVNLAQLPGKMGKDYGERCTEDYRLGARLTLNEFISVIINLVLFYNNSHCMEKYGSTIQMEQMGIMPIPLELWNFGMKYLSGAQRTLPRATVRYTLLPGDKASITLNGILFKGMLYGCEQGFREHWFDSARVSGRESITISYDPRDATFIYFKPSPDSEPVECYLLDSNKIQGQFSTEELDQMHQVHREKQEAYRPKEDFQRILVNRKIQEIIDKANNAFPDQLEQSKHQRVSSIRENRKDEIEAQYQQSILPSKEPSSESVQSTESNSGKSPIQRMLEEALDETY